LPIGSQAVVDIVFDALAEGRGGRIATVNVEFLQRARDDAEVARLYEASDLRVADGAPVLWLARLVGKPLPERVAGSDLVWRLAERAARSGRSLFLLGGDAGVADQAAATLQERHPSLRIVGCAAPQLDSPPRADQIASVRSDLERAAPDIVYCAFGTPKQEQVADALASALPGTWWLGCGASLSFIAGHMRRAPPWMQRLGLEWLHRTALEPRRLGRRYLLGNLPFLTGALLRSALRGRRG
jgi:N-acetylglucosaminyldiphosphoundecaprenol N-acetyl-beta-D-mannosaminyltransferase